MAVADLVAAVTAVAAAEAGRKISTLMAGLVVAHARRERLKFFLRTKRKLRLRFYGVPENF